ncbi:MAG: hypothetical protein JW940_11630 [Polyangiaceae bacterium]|nr:hypothetical protein [Polyangiaceae bacterium]
MASLRKPSTGGGRGCLVATEVAWPSRDERRRLEEQHAHLSAEQNRVRKNLDLLRKSKGNDALRASLTRKLEGLDADLGKLSGSLVSLSEKDAELTSRMKVLIRSVTLES